MASVPPPGPFAYADPVVQTQPNAVFLPAQGHGAITVRNMVKEDAEFAGRMTVEAFQSKFENAVGKNNIDKMVRAETKVHANIEDCYHRIFIALYNGERAGLVALKFHGDKNMEAPGNPYEELNCCSMCGLMCLGCLVEEGSVPRRTCYLDHICVDSAFRGKGIGKVLMDKAEEEARRNSCQSIFLWVADVNRAKNLYLRQGYRIVETEDGYCLTYCITGFRKFCKMVKDL